QPFHPAPIHEADIFMAVNLEQPEAVSGEPIVVVAVENYDVGWRNTRAAHQCFEGSLADNVPAHLVLKLRLPVETRRPGKVSRVIGLGVHVDLYKFDPGLA